jgi:hypothetical protein
LPGRQLRVFQSAAHVQNTNVLRLIISCNCHVISDSYRLVDTRPIGGWSYSSMSRSGISDQVQNPAAHFCRLGLAQHARRGEHRAGRIR